MIDQIKRIPESILKLIFGFLANIFQFVINLFANIKKTLVYRSFWGRSRVYKNVLHFSLLALTLVIFVTGVSSRFADVTISTAFASGNEIPVGNVDLLPQGGSIQTILATNPEVYFKVSQYTVKKGDTVQSIADKFKVSKDTIKWANPKINYYTELVEVGDILQIPEINGVLYTVQSGDILDSVLSKTSGDKFDVIEINQLEAPDFNLPVGKKILIPNGKLQPPAQTPVYYYPSILVPHENGTIQDLQGISFGNPLSNPACAGYIYQRGFSPWHNGVDLSKAGGCPVRAAADGEVIFAGWSTYGEGYNVRIYHGNGIETHYYHSNGNIWVKPGDHVVKGQDIMYMGCTGNCTGTHLHIGLKLNGQFIDPSPYIPY